MKTVLAVLIVVALFCAIYFALTYISGKCLKKKGELQKAQEDAKAMPKRKEEGTCEEVHEVVHETVHAMPNKQADKPSDQPQS